MKYSNDIYTFIIDENINSPEFITAREELSDRFSKFGIKLKVKPLDNFKTTIILQFTEESEIKRTRKAGRKRNTNENSNYTYGEIRKWKEDGVIESEILKKLQCTHTTLFRRLKEAKDNNYPDDMKWKG